MSVLETNPNLKLVICHLGFPPCLSDGGTGTDEQWYGLLDLANSFQVWFDTAIFWFCTVVIYHKLDLYLIGLQTDCWRCISVGRRATCSQAWAGPILPNTTIGPILGGRSFPSTFLPFQPFYFSFYFFDIERIMTKYLGHFHHGQDILIRSIHPTLISCRQYKSPTKSGGHHSL